MEKNKLYQLYQVNFMTKSNGVINLYSVQVASGSIREAIAEVRKFVFRNTGTHAFRCKAKLLQ